MRRFSFYRVPKPLPTGLWIFLAFLISYCGDAPKSADKGSPKTPAPEYTLEKPLEWEKWKQSHAPRVKIISIQGGKQVIISVDGKFSPKHYIEAFGIMDENKKVLAQKNIKRERNPKTSAIFQARDLPSHTKLKAFIKCNLHDLWVQDFVLQ